ncbi:MAG: hypothetical protein CL489_10295 [Acidobacteria bacterium]|nr:hypothetical protein [Acidobacteriota bacterium]|tara:strand:+ start:10089 stop:10373 length:285 start_codon:yes stop_codon:yes gene_type:complete
MSESVLKALKPYKLLAFGVKLTDSGHTITKEEFSHLIKTYLEVSGIELKEFAYSLDVSPPTAQRWFDGKNMPYQACAETVVKTIVKDLAEYYCE